MLYLLVETVAADDDSMVGEVEHFSSPLALIRVPEEATIPPSELIPPKIAAFYR